MLIRDEFFAPGKVVYNTFNIDYAKPFIEQLVELNEDLIQVEYGSEYILDIGWYPEGDENGRIIIQLVHNNKWDKPIVREEQIEKNSLLLSINKIISMVRKLQ